MKKRVLTVSLVLILITSIFLSFNVSADNVILDNLEINSVAVPEIPTDGLIDDKLSTDFNEVYYNADHYAAGEEDTTIFDEKQEFNTEYNLLDDNDSLVVNDNFDSVPALTADDGIALYSADDGAFVFPDGWNNNIVDDINGTGYNQWRNAYVTMSAINVLKYAIPYTRNYICPLYNIDTSLIKRSNSIIFHYENILSDKNTTCDKTRSTYTIYFIADDCLNLEPSNGLDYFHVDNKDSNPLANQNYICLNLSFYYQKDSDNKYITYCLSFNRGNIVVNGERVHIGNSRVNPSADLMFNIKDVYFGDVLMPKTDDSGLIDGDIVGDFSYNDKSTILNYKAYYSNAIDKSYDVHLFALDNSACPKMINDNLGYTTVDLNNYDNQDLKLTPAVNQVKASLNLEQAYYYIHKMKGYDDSIESVEGYITENDFEARDKVMFALAYREVGTSGDWIVCKYDLYNYTDLIDNTMGAFTVRKKYIDFPDMNDYIESFESWTDIALEYADDLGTYNKIEVGLQWIGRNLVHFAKNFIGFFQWIIACIPVLWDNLTIALYNLVCDIKELAIYLFKPKTKSIYQMANERIPSFNDLVNAFSNNSASELPSFTIFGTKFSLNFADYDIDFSFFRSMSTVIFYLLFGYLSFKLIFKIFGFGGSGDSGGDD